MAHFLDRHINISVALVLVEHQNSCHQLCCRTHTKPNIANRAKFCLVSTDDDLGFQFITIIQSTRSCLQPKRSILFQIRRTIFVFDCDFVTASLTFHLLGEHFDGHFNFNQFFIMILRMKLYLNRFDNFRKNVFFFIFQTHFRQINLKKIIFETHTKISETIGPAIKENKHPKLLVFVFSRYQTLTFSHLIVSDLFFCLLFCSILFQLN